MTSSRFDPGLTLKTLNLSFLPFNEQSGSENLVYIYIYIYIEFCRLTSFPRIIWIPNSTLIIILEEHYYFIILIELGEFNFTWLEKSVWAGHWCPCAPKNLPLQPTNGRRSSFYLFNSIPCQSSQHKA